MVVTLKIKVKLQCVHSEMSKTSERFCFIWEYGHPTGKGVNSTADPTFVKICLFYFENDKIVNFYILDS